MPHERAITRRKSTLNGFKRDSYTMYTSTHTQYRGKQPSLTAREQETEERELTCVVATSVYGFVGTVTLLRMNSKFKKRRDKQTN